MLWFYSTYFKKKLLLGNGMIGLLTTLVPLLSVWFFSVLNESQLTHSPFHEETWSHVMHYNFIYLLAICAGIQNFGREIVKDAEDVEGDKLIQVKSLAMKFGGRIAVLIALCLIQLSSILGILFFCVNNEFLNGYEIYFLGIASALNGIILIVYLVNKKIKIRTVHLILKVTMLIGLGSLFSVFI